LSGKKKLGIIGGMGPQATVYMFNKIVQMTGAKSDKDHIEIFIHNNTLIPDRTRAIVHNDNSPVPELIRSAKILQKMGADVLIIPCMTSHYFLKEIQKAIETPIINAIDKTVTYISNTHDRIGSAGILATSGTIQSRLFQRSLLDNDIQPIILSDDAQDNLVMSSIYGKRGIKAGFITPQTKDQLLRACDLLIKKGASLIIAGCTEIPLAMSQKDIHVPFIDVIEILSSVAIRKCLGKSCAV